MDLIGLLGSGFSGSTGGVTPSSPASNVIVPSVLYSFGYTSVAETKVVLATMLNNIIAAVNTISSSLTFLFLYLLNISVDWINP